MLFEQQKSFPASKGVDHWKIEVDAEDVNRYKNSKLVTRMVTKGENWRCKVYTKHIQDATSLALISKREIYEKLVNNRSEGEMRNW